jgi:hypothetical protein
MGTWSRRLRQLPLLFKPPAQARRIDRRVATGGSTLSVHDADGQRLACACVDVAPGGLKVTPALLDMDPGTAAEVESPAYFRRVAITVLRHGVDSTVLTFTDPDRALAFVGLLSAAARPED